MGNEEIQFVCDFADNIEEYIEEYINDIDDIEQFLTDLHLIGREETRTHDGVWVVDNYVLVVNIEKPRAEIRTDGTILVSYGDTTLERTLSSAAACKLEEIHDWLVETT